MPDVVLLGRRVKDKYPGVYDDIPDGVLGRKVKAKFPGAYDDFTDTGYTPPPERSAYQSVSGGLAQAGGTLAQAGLSLYEAGKGAVTGDFGPAKELGESALRGASSLAGYLTAGAPPDTRIAELERQRLARQGQTPAGQFIQQRNAQLAAEAEQDKSLKNRVARGAGRIAGEVAPAVVTGVLTGGSAPAIAATTALQSAGQPENIVPAALAGAVPVPVSKAFKAGVAGIRRIFGKGAAQIIEAEAAGSRLLLPPGPEGLPNSPILAGPSSIAGETAPTTQRAMQQFEQEVQRISALPEAQQAAEMEAAIRRISSEASGVRPVSPQSRAGYPPMMEFPENPNPIQMQAGRLPFEGVEAPPSPDIAERVAGMARTPTSPVSIPELRAEFPGMSKQQFDDELLKAAEEGKIAIHRHDAPGQLTESERNGLLKVGNDYFNAATMRGPSVSAPMDLNAAVADAAESVARPRVQRAKDELLGVLGASKSLRSTADISYPLRQGALLLLRPLQWRQAGKVWKEMFRGFRTKNFDAIKQAIENHPLAGRMDSAGLYRGTQAAGEEAFGQRAGSKVSEIVRKTPIIKQSEQAYNAAADTQRVQAFEQYAKLIDKAGLSPEEALKADKAAAQWINIATGRGSLGKRIDKAFEALNFAFFSPRYVASRLNVLNPAMYIRNASSPGGRVVLKQQMSDLMQFASVVATTMYLAKQAGADVNLHVNSPDFLKIRVGNWRYDPLAGLQQVMRLIYRVGADVNRAAHGEKPKPGQTAIDIGETFLNYKLSPPAGVFRDFINGRTLDKKPFTAARAIADLTAPMQWADFVEAYQKEGWGGVGMASPGFPGIGVQNYEQNPVDAAIERAQPLFTELKRLNKTVSELKKRGEGDKKEPDDIFNARVQQFGQNYTLYALKLLESPRYQSASDDTKAKALEALNTRAKVLTTRDMAFPELELDANTILDAVQSAEERKQERVRQRGF